jgi:type II secretion system protein N
MNYKPNLLLYLVAAFFFFFFWLYIVFPYNALKSRVVTEIENRLEGHYHLDVASMDVSIFGSVTFKNLKVTEGAGEGEKILLNTPKLKLGFSPFALLTKQLNFSYYLKGSKGDLEGDFSQDNDEFNLSLSLNKYPISELGFIAAKTSMTLKGILDGDVDIHVNKSDPSHNHGKINVELQNLSMEGAKVNLDPSAPDSLMDIPPIKITGDKDSRIQGELQKDSLVVKSISLKGGDIDLNLDGKITLQGANPIDYRMALQGSFKITQALTKALPVLLILEQQKSPDGSYPLNISGRLTRPNIRIGKFNVPL